MKTAILVDGGFFIRRANKSWTNQTPEQFAKKTHAYCIQHLKAKIGSQKKENGKKQNIYKDHDLYRIFYYDCPPLSKKLHHPLTNKSIDHSKTDVYKWRTDFHNQLRQMRKVALRLGKLEDVNIHWKIQPEVLKKLCKNEIIFSDIEEKDIILDIKQKGVDMRIGVDIASMAFKKQVDRIVLIAGDSDFVPAAKLARREGIDFILDPMHLSIKPDLAEHIDGISTYINIKF